MQPETWNFTFRRWFFVVCLRVLLLRVNVSVHVCRGFTDLSISLFSVCLSVNSVTSLSLQIYDSWLSEFIIFSLFCQLILSLDPLYASCVITIMYIWSVCADDGVSVTEIKHGKRRGIMTSVRSHSKSSIVDQSCCRTTMSALFFGPHLALTKPKLSHTPADEAQFCLANPH